MYGKCKGWMEITVWVSVVYMIYSFGVSQFELYENEVIGAVIIVSESIIILLYWPIFIITLIDGLE